MALATTTFISGLKTVKAKPRLLFSGPNNVLSAKVLVACITGRASRIDPVEKPAPWPYMTKGFFNWHAYIDGTKKRFDENTKVIVVEGLPAIGKSAMARTLAEELEMKYFPMVTANHQFITKYGYDTRQVDKYLPKRIRTFDELDFVKDPKNPKVIRLQMQLWYQKLRQYFDALAHVLNTGQGVVLDRCVFSDVVFTDTLFEMGYVSKIERDALLKMKNKIMSKLLKPHLIIYLDAPVSLVEENLKKRGKGEEKVWNKEMLEKFEHIYKHTYLQQITKHAELLAYDWSTPGDSEVIVEDIERIDFDRFDIHDPKMKDWRIKEDWDWAELRWIYTKQKYKTMGHVAGTATVDCEILDIRGEEQDQYEEAMAKIPGTQYTEGFNEDAGDTNLWFKQPRIQTEVWEDHGVGPKAANL